MILCQFLSEFSFIHQKIDTKIVKMGIFFYTTLFGIFLTECNAGFGGPFITLMRPKNPKSRVEPIPPSSDYDGNPISIACVIDKDQKEFDVVEVTQEWPSSLLKRLDNGNGLSVLFHGAAYKTTKKSGLMFWFAREWMTTSGNNICIISYAYTSEPSESISEVGFLNKMVSQKRIEYAAQMGCDLIKGVQDICWNDDEGGRCLNIHEVDVIGLSFGSRVAAKTCEYITKKTNGEKLKMLLALDPSKDPSFSAKSDFKRLAHYVQVIHTSSFPSQQIGDIDIHVKSKSGISLESGLDFFMFVATATKRLYALAAESGDGTMILKGQPFPEAKPKECVVGVYSNPNPNQYGKKFVISIAKRVELFRESLGMYQEETIFFE
ncbi:uncharacterized protein LOC116348368 [Contarinia nasturtii]|uniref:uncharacterized protein LOC116348368 n=1 Tax=Contarinia nasturtii TaxID=265458 RepID=UPI0012D4BE3C|nr:uncharacterized protein LOC116348368 [Contarinia nasturtii]